MLENLTASNTGGYRVLLNTVYEDYMSHSDRDIPNRKEIIREVETNLNTIEDLDEFTDQAKYAISMCLMDLIGSGNKDELLNFLSLDTDTMYYNSEEYQWQPKEFDKLDDLLGYITQCALDVYTGAEEPEFESAMNAIETAKDMFNTLWSSTIKLQGDYGNHIYLTELLASYEDCFYKNVSVIMGNEDAELSEPLMELLGYAEEDTEWLADLDLQSLIEAYTGEDLVAKINSEGYKVLEMEDDNLTLCVGCGINSNGWLN